MSRAVYLSLAMCSLIVLTSCSDSPPEPSQSASIALPGQSLELAANDLDLCNYIGEGNLGVLYGLRVSSSSSSDITLESVALSGSDSLEVLDAALLPVDVGAIVDRFPATVVPAQAWDGRQQLSAGGARLAPGTEERLMIAVGLTPGHDHGVAHGLVVQYRESDTLYKYETSTFSIEVHELSGCG
jgi:hypothetical protein